MRHARGLTIRVLIPLAGLLISASAPAAGGSTRPVWAKPKVLHSPAGKNANCSYLDDFGWDNGVRRNQRMREKIFDEGLTNEMRTQYTNITKEYEAREAYHLNRLDQSQDQNGQKQGFVRYYLLRLFHFHVKDGIGKAEKNSDEVRVFKKVYDKGEQLVNEGVKIEAGEKVKFGTNLDVRQMRGGLWMKSAVVDSSFDIVAGAPAYRDPNNPDPNHATDPTYREERYKLTVSRKLPIWNLNSGVSYGTTSTTVSSSLSKQLNEHLVCVVSHSVPMNPERSDVHTGQETAQVQYQLHF